MKSKTRTKPRDQADFLKYENTIKSRGQPKKLPGRLSRVECGFYERKLKYQESAKKPARSESFPQVVGKQGKDGE